MNYSFAFQADSDRSEPSEPSSSYPDSSSSS